MQPQQNTQEGEDNASPNHQWNYGFPPGWMGWSSYGGGGEDQQLVGGPGTWPSLREGIEQQQWVAWQQGMVAAHPGLYSPFASASAGYQISPQPHSSPFVHPQDGLRTSAVPSGDNAGNGWQYYPSAESPAPEPRSGGYQQYLFSQTSPGYADVGQGDDYAYSTWGAGVDPSFQFSMLGDLTPQGTNQAVFSCRDRGTLAAQRYLPAVLIWEKCINVDIVTSRQGCGQTIRNFLTKCTEKLLPIDKHLPGLGSKDKVILASTLTPFGHPLMQLVIPPPSMRYIHPAVTDASLYCLRVPNTKQTDKKPHFRLSSTGDPGFENSVTADWLVALVGLLYYALPPLRISVSRHYCDEPVCWICELSFVFRCLDVSKQEGRAQPVRIASFAEALFRAGPIMTLGLHEAGPGEVEFRDANSLIVQKDIQESRVTHRIRDSMGLKSATPQWLRHGPEARRPSLQELSVEDISTLASRAQRRRNRVARAVRRNESEKRKARFQEHHRNRLHYRCHQVLNYLLHSFLKLPPQCPNPLLEMTEDLEEFPELHAHKTRSSRPTEKPSKAPGVLFSFKVESITECKQGDSIKLNDQLLLELDHTPWTNIKSVEIDTQESNPISTSSSFLRSNSRPTSSSGVSSVSSVSSLDTHTKLPTLQHAHGPFTRASSSPLMLVDKVPDFCRLLQQSLWKSQAVPMVCSKCESSNTTRHTVRHQVTALPPVLCVKIKLDASPDATPPLRFWRLQFPPSSVSPRTIYTHGLRTGAVTTDDDTDMSRLIAKYTKARSEWLSETDPVAKAEKQFTLHHLASMLDLVCDASASPLPAALYIHKENATRDGNPWSVSTQPPGKGLTVCSCTRHACDKCHRYDLIGVVASINYNWNRARKKLSWLSWTDDLAPRLGIKRKTNCKRSNRVSNLQELRNQVPCLSSAEKERFAQRVEAEEAMIEAPPDEDHLVSHVRCPTRPGDPTKWLFINGPVVAESTEDEARRFGYTWKFPVAFFFARTDVIWEHSYLESLPPQPPPLPSGEVLFRSESISQVPVSRRQHPRFAPLTARELDAINQGGVMVALDAEHVVLRMLDRSPTSIAPSHAQLALGRLSACRADGREYDTLPFLDHYLHFRDEPLDYRSQFSGLYPGDLDVTGSVHWLATHKEIYQILRYLVEKKCKFIGHDLFNDFRVIGIIVSQSQIIDTVEIFRQSIYSRFLSLKFLCYYVLNVDIQDQTHDSIEDAQAALALYRYFVNYVEKESLDKFQKDRLPEIYSIGFQTQFKILRDIAPFAAEPLNGNRMYTNS